MTARRLVFGGSASCWQVPLLVLVFINELMGRTAFAARESIDFTVIAPMPQNYPILAASCAQVASEMPRYVAIRSINDFNERVPDCNPANPKITGGKANANQSPKGSKGTPTPDSR